MNNSDILQRFIFENLSIRGEYIHLEDSFTQIVDQHRYPESIRLLLGETLAIAGLLAAIIKFKGRLTVQFKGEGKLKLLLAQCTNKLTMRGLAKWEGDLSYGELMAAFKEGILVIMLDGGDQKQYQGIVAWQDSLAASIEAYFQNSEQLATKLWLAVDVTRASGILLQIIPAAGQDPSLVLEKQDSAWQQVVTATNQSYNALDFLNLDTKPLLRKLYPHEEITLFSAAPVSFKCSCSRARSEDAIYLLGREEAEEELKDKQVIVVTCDFCNKDYTFDRVEVEHIFKKKDATGRDDHLH